MVIKDGTEHPPIGTVKDAGKDILTGMLLIITGY